MICPNCGTRLPEGDTRCHLCGFLLPQETTFAEACIIIIALFALMLAISLLLFVVTGTDGDRSPSPGGFVPPSPVPPRHGCSGGSPGGMITRLARLPIDPPTVFGEENVESSPVMIQKMLSDYPGPSARATQTQWS